MTFFIISVKTKDQRIKTSIVGHASTIDAAKKSTLRLAFDYVCKYYGQKHAECAQVKEYSTIASKPDKYYMLQNEDGSVTIYNKYTEQVKGYFSTANNVHVNEVKSYYICYYSINGIEYESDETQVKQRTNVNNTYELLLQELKAATIFKDRFIN